MIDVGSRDFTECPCPCACVEHVPNEEDRCPECEAGEHLTLGDLNIDLGIADLDPAAVARALRKTYPEHLRRSNDDQLLGDARFFLRTLREDQA